MSFGRPGTFDNFKVTPPARGSFPLDHYEYRNGADQYTGECKDFMVSYLKCLKANSADNGQCRPESRAYLECRMDKGLMQRDDMQNLGLGDVGIHRSLAAPIGAPSSTVPPSSSSSDEKRTFESDAKLV